MKVLRTVQQTHTGDKTDQPEIMIAMQMGSKNMVDLAPAYFVFRHLQLRAFPAINQKEFLLRL